MKRILFFIALGAFCTKSVCMDSRKSSFSTDLMSELDAIGGKLNRLERTGSSPVGLDFFVQGVSPTTSHELVARLASIQATQARLAQALEDLTFVGESIPCGGARTRKKLGLQDVQKRFMELEKKISEIAEVLEPQTHLVRVALSAPVTPRVVSQEPHEFVDVVRLDSSEDQHSSDGEAQPDGQTTRVYDQAEAINRLAASLNKQSENQRRQRILALQRRGARSVPASMPAPTVNADDASTAADEEQAGVAK